MTPASSAPLPLKLDTSYAAMREIGDWLDQVVASTPGRRFADKRGEIELAVHELAVNIVDHAFTIETRPNGSLELSAEIVGDTLLVRSFDSGNPVIVLPDAPDPDSPQVRGYGLMIVEQLATSVHYQRSLRSNRWTVAFEAAHP